MWWNLVIGLIFTAISWLLRPKPEPPQAATIGDFNVPITEEGAEVGKVYGTVWVTKPQVVWYGDYDTVPIKSKQGKK